jgi:formylglycine-generating enzyme required for sulfatase activity
MVARAVTSIARALAAAMLLATPACNSLTGASGYANTTSCTGPACAAQCFEQGGQWNTSADTCTCAGGIPLCNGTCCGGTAPYCVLSLTGVQRCSACTAATFECGATCCEDQECLNAEIGSCGAQYGVPGQSCAGGLVCPVPTADGGIDDADCCQSIPPSAGTFEMGRSLEPGARNLCPDTVDAYAMMCGDDELPAHPVTLSPYTLDRFEVTIGRFRKFVDAWDYMGLPEGAGGTAAVAGAGWQSEWNTSLPTTKAELERDVECLTDTYDIDPPSTWTEAPGFYENLPVTCVTWYEAFAFCVWDGGRLPTEAEWEFAAANGAAADLYPWGEAVPTPSMSVYQCKLDLLDPCLLGPSFPAYVGSRPTDANVWGHRDLAGNVGEWVLDSVYTYTTAAATNPASTAPGFRAIRGGDFNDSAFLLRAVNRSAHAPTANTEAIGFRCARSM